MTNALYSFAVWSKRAKNSVEGCVIAGKPSSEAIQNGAARLNHKRAALLPRVALHSPLPVTTKPCADVKPARDRVKDRPDASPKPGQSVRVALRVADNRDIVNLETLLKRARHCGPAVSNDNDVRPQRPQLRNSRPQLGHLVTAERSPKVAHKNKHRRPLAPKLPERHSRARRVLDDNLTQ